MEQETAAESVYRSNVRPNDGRSSAHTEDIEVRVRPERHRRWRPEEKLRIVQETLRPGTVIAAVARRHGVGTGLLHTWRKDFLTTAVTGFVPVQVEPQPIATAPHPNSIMPAADTTTRARPAPGRIEIEFTHGIRVRLDGVVDETVLRCVLSALGDR